MTVSTKVYGLALNSAFNKEVDFNSDTIKVSLHTSSYIPDQDAHQYWDVSVNNQCSGSGYTAGGASIGTPTISYDGPSNTFKLTGDPVAWAGNTVTARYAVIYDSTPSSNKPLIAFVDFGEDLTPLAITWNANGIVTATIA